MAGTKRYTVERDENERNILEGVIDGKSSGQRQKRAHILQLADQGEPRERTTTDAGISRIVGVHVNTVERLRKSLVLEGFEAALEHRVQVNRKRRKLDGEAEARLIALACSEAPEGATSWRLKACGQAGGTGGCGVHVPRNGSQDAKTTTLGRGRTCTTAFLPG